MAYKDGVVTAPVSMKDVENAVGVPQSAGLASQCASPNINPMAKYKPVRYNKIGELTEMERISTRHGFGSQAVPSFTGGDENPSITWTYDRVRAGTDWARLTDFDGYHSRACVPLVFTVSGALRDGLGFTIFVNQYAADVKSGDQSFGTWGGEHNMSIQDMFPTNSVNSNAATSSYVAFCLHDLTKGDHCVVVTKTTLATLIQTTVPTIVIRPEDSTSGGVHYPAVPMINDASRSGHLFRIIIGLIGQSSAPSSSSPDAYKVYTSTTSPTVNALTLYSMAFREGCDRVEITLSDTHSILGLSFTLQNSGLALTHLGEETKYGTTCQKYKLSGTVQGTIKTPTGHWSPDFPRVILNITASESEGGYVEIEDANGFPVGELVKAIDISSGNTTYNLTLFNFASGSTYYNVYLYAPHKERCKMKLSAYVSNNNEQVPASNSITIHGPNIK